MCYYGISDMETEDLKEELENRGFTVLEDSMKISLTSEATEKLEAFLGNDKTEIEKGANAIILSWFDVMEKKDEEEE